MKLLQSACEKLILPFIFFLAPVLFSQTEWTALNGPEGGKITAVQIDPVNPNVILIGTDGGGVFQSFDGGANWSPKNQGLAHLHVYSLVFTFSEPKILFCGTEQGLFKSADFGESWTPSVFDSLQINAIKFHPAKPGFIFLATHHGLYRSVDQGENWNQLATNIPAEEFYALMLHASDDHTLLVGTEDGVYLSHDLGDTWDSFGLQREVVQTLSMHASSQRTMYAGTRANGVFRNLTGGKSWEALTPEISAKNIRQLLNDPVSSGTIYAVSSDAGIFKSTNRGDQWTALKNGLPLTSCFSIGLNPFNNQQLLVGTVDGVYSSPNGGQQWERNSAGIIASKINALAINPQNSGSIFGGTQNQVRKSCDRGKTWLSSEGGFLNYEITAVAVCPADTHKIWAGTAENGVWLSTDAGQTWRQTSEDFSVTQIQVNPRDSQKVYLVTNTGILKTENFGATWSEKNTGLPSAPVQTLLVNSANPLELFVGIDGHGVYKSANGGERWFARNTGIENRAVFSLLQNVGDGTELFLAGTSAGLFKSTDLAASWVPDGFVAAPVTKLANSPSNPGLIYAVTADQTVILSPDRGETWQTISEAGQIDVISLAVDPVTSGLAFAGSFGKGVFQYHSQFPFISVPFRDLNFGDVRVDSTRVLEFKIQNIGSTELQIQKISVDSDRFRVVLARNVIPANGEISVELFFSPNAAQNFQARLEIQSNDPARSVLRIPVQGRGIAPELALSGESIHFGSVRKNQSQQRALSVSNPGTAPLKINALELQPGAFTVVNTEFTLNPSESREITLTFSPPDTGIFRSSLVVRSSVRDLVVQLSGYGVWSKMEVSATEIDFGATILHQPVRRMLEISNSGNAALVFTRIAVTHPDLFTTKGIPDSLAAFSKTTLEVVFQPANAGTFSAALNLESNGGKFTIALTGAGILPPFHLSADSLFFGRVRVGKTGSAPEIYLKNQSPVAVKLHPARVRMPEIFQVFLADSEIAAQDSLKIQVQFRPELAKNFVDTLLLESEFWQTRVRLRGEGIAPDIQLSRQALVFPRVKVGRATAQQITLSNIGNDTLHVFSLSTGRAEFTVTPEITLLAPGAQQDFTVQFQPSAGMVFQDTLKILSDLAETRIPLTGAGERVRLAFSAASLNFGQRLILAPCFEQFFFYNQGSHDLTLNSISLKLGAVFEVAPSQAMIRPGDSLKAVITFLPREKMVYSDSLICQFADDEFLVLPLAGAGMIPAASPHLVIEPDSLQFPRTRIQQTTGQTVRIANVGSRKLFLTPPQPGETAFFFTSFPTVLDSGQDVQMQVHFQPSARKIYQEKIYILSNANLDSIFLSGAGVAPQIVVSDSVIVFANTPVDSFRQTSLVVKNTGNDTLRLASITALPDEFQVEPQSAQLNSGDSLTVRLNFFPRNTGVFKGLLTILGNDPFRAKFEIQITGTSYGPDRSGPVVLHSPTTTAPANQPITVTAQISDENSGVSSARVFFRNGGSKAFEAPLDITSGTTQLPARFANTRGVEYYLLATDHAGLCTRTPKESSFFISIVAEAPGEFQRDEFNQPVALPSGSAQTAYHLFSIPLILDNPHPQDVLADALGAYDEHRWVFADFNPKLGDADGFVYLTEPKKIADFAPGKAFWILSSEPEVVVKSGRGRSVNTLEAFRLPLPKGWNLIGNPFTFPIDAGQLYLQSGDAVYLYTYQSQWDTATVLNPWEGYAVFNFSELPDTLLIYPHADLVPELGKNLANPTAEFDWRLNLVAACETARDHLNWVGASRHATFEWDRFDQPEPPGVGEFISLYFPHRDWELPTHAFTTDFQPVQANGYSWMFEVATNIKNAKVTLKVNGLRDLPPGYQVLLRDRQTGVTQEISGEIAYEYPVFDAGNTRSFDLMVGQAGWLSAQNDVAPKVFDLSPAFPNPARAATVIRYSLPKVAEVTLTVYNINGQQIRSLLVNQSQNVGHHLTLWDGRNQAGQRVANGVYFYQLQTVEYQQTRKVLMLH